MGGGAGNPRLPLGAKVFGAVSVGSIGFVSHGLLFALTIPADHS
jgi:hypothetical protein